METITYGGWKNNLRLANREIELVVTLDVGPRIIRFGFNGGPNAFKEYNDQLGGTSEKEWKIRGGHRLWHAPEAQPRTYFPDNGPVKWQATADHGVRLTSRPETPYGVQKELDVRLHQDGNRVSLVHRLTNVGPWPVELAAWALTVLAPGGTEIIPLPGKVPHPQGLLPNQTLVLWPYADLADPRFTWGTSYVLVRSVANTKPTKIGLAHREGWVAYWREGLLFVKRFAYKEGARYADRGCNFETFTNDEMLECETLGALVRLEPGHSATHAEEWELFRDVPAVSRESEIDRTIRPLAGKKG